MWRNLLSAAVLALPCAAAQAGTDAASKARAVLDLHCARCHQTGRLENPPAKGGLGNVLDLAQLTERDDLIVPSDPDASRFYQIMLARHRPLSVFFGPVPGPTPAEIGVVRDWLTSLPEPGTACAGKAPVTDRDLERDITAWRKAFETDPAKPLRFISLANLHNLCRSDATLAAYRESIATLMGRLTLRTVATLDTVGEASVLLAFSPSDLGLTAEAWDLRAGRGDDIRGVVAAEELAARAIAAAAPSARVTASPIAQAVAAPAAASHASGVDPVDALAHEYTRTVTLRRAAVELRLETGAVRTLLAETTGDDRVLTLQLAQTGLPRADWEKLKADLADRSPPLAPPTPAKTNTTPALALRLWTDAPDYKVGDLLTVRARPSGDCNLTIVAVEADGLATVLFPNDTAPDNRVTADTLVTVPPEGAPFQFRLDQPGRHGVVAICNAAAKRPQGIGHDFERQRFTVLGDWRTFLIETPEREAAYQKTQEELRRFRTGAGGADILIEQLPQGTEDEARAGLSVEVR